MGDIMLETHTSIITILVVNSLKKQFLGLSIGCYAFDG